MKLHRLMILAMLLVFSLTLGCSTQNPPSSPSTIDSNAPARVVVTKGFGQDTIIDVTVDLEEKTNAMEALREVAELKTSYGGGFVDAINGVAGEGSSYWFWYVNGMQSKTGARDYDLRHGDTEHWVYRDSSYRQNIPAIIGHFPEPFLHGYGGIVAPTIVVWETGFEQEAKTLKDKLINLGVVDVADREVSRLTQEDKKGSNLIIVGTGNVPLISELNSGKLYRNAGFYVRFKEDTIETFSLNGDSNAQYGEGLGIIQATQNPWNPKGILACENVVWMVSGMDVSGVKAAVKVLIERSDELQLACAVIVTDTGVHRIPQ